MAGVVLTGHGKRPLGVLPVRIVIVPPPVGRGLGVVPGGVLPLLLASERRDVEIVPRAPHRLVATTIHGIRRRSAARPSRARVNSFSFNSIRSQASCHSCGETIAGFCIETLPPSATCWTT